nr:glycosyl hydrolase family protein [Naematelia aurantialba]
MKPLLSLALALVPLVSAVHLSNSTLDNVYSVMQNISQYSWENGTKSEAILERTYPSLSIFSSTAPLPLPASLPQDDISQIIDIAHTTLNNRPASNTSASAHGGSSLLSDGAASDPASLGVAILLANWSTDNALWNNVGYGDAATAELNYLLYDVPRSSEGAISHRADQVQFWSDFVYMVPPFLAYYGALQGNQTLLQEAYTQCSLYRAQLRQSNGLWNHIEGGTTQNGGASDPRPWSTGNAWAAAGMLRVLATIQWSSFASQMSSEVTDLQTWVEEILTAVQPYIVSCIAANNATASWELDRG